MVLLNAENISKSYTEKPLLKNISLSISENEKTGLIGVNGTGKSTLLRILAGAEEADSGKITRTRGITVSYLPQNPPYDPELSVDEQAERYLREINETTPEYQCRSMMTKLGITDFDARMGELSGGQRKRVALAAVLCTDADLIILDEPTNHMDNGVIDWLESFLKSSRSSIFMITHDRYFLDNVTDRIVEIDNGSIYSYEGNYDYYLQARAAREESLLASERKRAAMYKKELAWIRRGARARTTKAKSHIERFEELRDSRLVIDDSRLEMNAASSRLGKKIIEIEGLCKSFDGKKLIEDFSYTLIRNDRIGIIGDNGSGKSTLLKMIMGEIEPDAGSISLGETVKIGYFSQETHVFDPEQRVIKYVEGISDNVKTDDGYVSATQMLERFLFKGDKQSVKIGRLSGGEKRRLYLLSILMQAPNVLIFDEPTNDLDITTLAILEDYLDSFPGALIVVSHDRYFLDRLCTRTFSFEGNGIVRQYPGGWTDTMKAKEFEALKKELEEKPPAPVQKKKERRSSRGEKLRFTFKEQKEFETIDSEIEALEDRMSEIDREMAGATDDYKKLQELSEERKTVETQLEEKTERWVYLNELAEKIENQ
ncbi:MAG: ABC-F family ATP-binding cassette domain-containing protein [Firmicutes bacterium]|nr:ABC-F family ATP-binding cassette domain-containing protein [Bacillota bacterium]